jgi:hypothetical protein
MILRCTAKILTLLGTRPAELATPPASDDDWYLNLLWIDRRKCLLLTHAGTLFPVFVAGVRKAAITPIGPYVVSLAEENLSSEGLAPDALGRLDREDVLLAKTASRSILGVMNDTAVHARYRIAAMRGIDRTDTVFLNRYLRRALHNRAGTYVTPLDLVAQRARLESADSGGRERPARSKATTDGPPATLVQRRH